MDPKVIDELARRLAAAGSRKRFSSRTRDLEAELQVRAPGGTRQLDLVTRTEFDVQAGVLKRTREMLEALETRLRELEADFPRSRRSVERSRPGRASKMLATVLSRAQIGMEAPQVSVEVHVGAGLPCSRSSGSPKRW